MGIFASVFRKVDEPHAIEGFEFRPLTTMPDGQPLAGIAVVRPDEEGFLKLESTLFHASLSPDEFAQSNYATLRRRMDRYFKAKIEVFEREGPGGNAETGTAPAQTNEGGGAPSEPTDSADDVKKDAAADPAKQKAPAAAANDFDLARVFWNAENARAHLKSAHRVRRYALYGLLPGFLLALYLTLNSGLLTTPEGSKQAAGLLTIALAWFAAWMVIAVFSSLIFRIMFNRVLPGGYRDSGIWPGFLELRLMKDIRSKFEGVDEEIRSLTDIFAKIFLHNLRRFVYWKRNYQQTYSEYMIYSAAAAWLLYTLPAPFVALAIEDTATESIVLAAMAVAILGALWSVVNGRLLYWFDRNNRETSTNNYNANLTVTCAKVAHEISTRMSSLAAMVVEFKKRQGDLLLKGEKVEENVQNDAEFSKHFGFFYTQVILWISKRSEYLQLYLVDRMQEMQREFFVLDIEGYEQAFAIGRRLATIAVWLTAIAGGLTYVYTGYVVPEIMRVVSPESGKPNVKEKEPEQKQESNDKPADVTPADSGGNPPPDSPPPGESLTWIAPYAFLLALWAYVMYVIFFLARRSYSNPAWNPQFERLKTALDTENWTTFNKLRVDETLAAQYQRALGAIHIAEERLAKKN